MTDKLEMEIARRRAIRCTALTAAGVLATGAATLDVIHGADPAVTAPAVWAVAFFVSAQLAGVTTLLAVLQTLALRQASMRPDELALLIRRDLCALMAAGATMFAAGAGLPGHGSPIAILAGPVLVIVALVAVLHARGFIRRLDGALGRTVRSPLEDVVLLLHSENEPPTALLMLAPTALVAAAAAFLRDTAEHASPSNAALTAGIEALAVVACFVTLGQLLGLWRFNRG
ncbi:hypothetical protein [Solirubrobacter soli]|uniref:hypothetical protein n=1 Tax=Solirubrobacter soli TaxID=363832 RepID=UPI000406B05C|nr:hypothetical protein [Solirubrobacter soli]